jgi:hypothetical protein
MNLLDENIPEHQRQLLRGWRIPVHQIGYDVGHKGISDDAIIVLLHQLPRPTFFTRDDDFHQQALCHPDYCVVYKRSWQTTDLERSARARHARRPSVGQLP